MKLHGILLLDKPAGYTSNQILQKVKKLLNITTKAGHTGSLDPLATGMLPICLGEATKFAAQLLVTAKTYQVTIQLGIKTDTADLDGKVIAQDSYISADLLQYDFLQEVLSQFVGESMQKPPVYSALKSNGIPLYRLARNSRNKAAMLSGSSGDQDNRENLEIVTKDLAAIVAAKTRKVNINYIKILAVDDAKLQLVLEVACSKGTYIRALVEDIASKLGCYGAVAALRRIKVSNFTENSLITLERLQQLVGAANNKDDGVIEELVTGLLLPVEQCLDGLPRSYLDHTQAIALQRGQTVHLSGVNDLLGENTLVGVFTVMGQKLIGLGNIIANDMLVGKRLLSNEFMNNVMSVY